MIGGVRKNAKSAPAPLGCDIEKVWDNTGELSRSGEVFGVRGRRYLPDFVKFLIRVVGRDVKINEFL
jgi:hypothetical protein